MKQLLKRFLIDDEQGSIAIMFAVTLIPLFVMIGVSVDYGRTYGVKQNLAKASDAAVLAAAKSGPNLTDEELVRVAGDLFRANLVSQGIDIGNVSHNVLIENNSSRITLTANSRIPLYFMRIAGRYEVNIGNVAKAERTISKLEVVLAIDTTGSMRWRVTSGRPELRYEALKRAGVSLVDTLYENAQPDAIKTGIIYWNHNVRQVSNMRRNAPFSCNVKNRTWQNGRDRQGKARGTTFEKVCSKLEPFEMTDDAEALRREFNDIRINDMRGVTDAQSGIYWAENMLDPRGSFQKSRDLAGFKDATVRKAIVLLTDGITTPYGYHPNGVLRTRASVNKDIQKKCAKAKRRGIVVYTIGFGSGAASQTTKKLLRDCATEDTNGRTKHYFDAKDEDALKTAFDEIASSLQQLRLSF